MKLHTVWAVRKHSCDEPELLTAWDEYSVDANPEGFEEDWRDHLKAMGDDFLMYRHINITVDGDLVTQAFQPVEIGITP